MSEEKLNQQIKIMLNNKFGSEWRLNHSRKSNSCVDLRFICNKFSCNCACKAIIDNKTKIAKIYWNEKKHNH